MMHMDIIWNTGNVNYLFENFRNRLEIENKYCLRGAEWGVGDCSAEGMSVEDREKFIEMLKQKAGVNEWTISSTGLAVLMKLPHDTTCHVVYKLNKVEWYSFFLSHLFNMNEMIMLCSFIRLFFQMNVFLLNHSFFFSLQVKSWVENKDDWEPWTWRKSWWQQLLIAMFLWVWNG